MNEFLDQALNKLAETVSGQKENAMAPSVREALTDFCRQDAEFAQAVAQGGSFKNCMTAVAEERDLQRGLLLRLCPTAEEAPRSAQKKILDIADFL